MLVKELIIKTNMKAHNYKDTAVTTIHAIEYHYFSEIIPIISTIHFHNIEMSRTHSNN